MDDKKNGVEKKIKILCVFGTRPEATKMAPLVLALKACRHTETEVCVTAQHREQLDAVLDAFGIAPQYDLNLMTAGQSLSDIHMRALKGLEEVIARSKPDLLLAHGDTATTFAASLAAFYAGIKCGHVEAGLRTFEKFSPYPEEINRKLTTVLSDLHFAPTFHAKENLLKENVPPQSVFVTGNTAIDAVKYAVRANHVFKCEALNKICEGSRLITMTAHRRENLGRPMENICDAVLSVTENFKDVTVVYPVHLNPKVRETVFAKLADKARIILTEPVDIFDLINLMARSYLVLTDSGGIQEEAAALGKPVVVMREVTERPEGLAAGTLLLAGTQTQTIFNAVAGLLTNKKQYEDMANAKNPFGDGYASERILEAVLQVFGINTE
ncbi:MAG: UDP-N-acetylglucosamine 2-epimerase (non-hydrolyzing) [Defluviitaleaceae bacterium]|nr:UDP-N-acetylglucosamine 2-epimerase (non-hydrolyzing) [Defluviitaleaceae bacterium]